MEPRKNFNIQFDKLYLRVTALLNGREVHYDYVISPNADDLTDETGTLGISAQRPSGWHQNP